MYIFLGFIALILSAIGLYTLVSLSIIRRTKEIGVRKVMGASIWEIYTDLNAYTFIVPVILILFVAVVSIGWEVYSAASRNPAESLRYE